MPPIRPSGLLLSCALTALAACSSTPQATPSQTPTTPEQSIPLVGDGLPSDVPTLPDPRSCNWSSDEAVARQFDPEGHVPFDGIVDSPDGLVAYGENAALASGGLTWNRHELKMRYPSGHGSIAGEALLFGGSTTFRFDGERWQQDAGNAGSDVVLTGATEAHDTEIAVGFKQTDNGERVALRRHDGRRWLPMSAPRLGTGMTQRLNGVDAAAGDAIAVGVADAGTRGLPLVLRFDGTRWARERITPPKKAEWTELNAVIARSDGFLAVGETWLPDGMAAIAYRSDDGRTWRRVAVPRPGLHGTRSLGPPFGPSLLSIGGTDDEVFAVGGSDAKHPRGDSELLGVAFVVRYDGTRFVMEEMPRIPGEQDPILITGVATGGTPPRTIAVGIYGNRAVAFERKCGLG